MTSPIRFVQEVIDEFKKVSWPTRAQTLRLTAYVIGVSVVVGLYVSGLDFGLTEAFEGLLNVLK